MRATAFLFGLAIAMLLLPLLVRPTGQAQWATPPRHHRFDPDGSYDHEIVQRARPYVRVPNMSSMPELPGAPQWLDNNRPAWWFRPCDLRDEEQRDAPQPHYLSERDPVLSLERGQELTVRACEHLRVRVEPFDADQSSTIRSGWEIK